MFHKVKSHLKAIFPALKHRNFRLFFIGQTLSLIGTYLQNTAEQWLVYAILTNSKIALGILSAVHNLPTTFLSLVAGEMADRKERKTILIYCQFLMMISAFILGLLVYQKIINFYFVIILGLFLGIASAFEWPTRQSFWPEIVSQKEEIVSAISLNAAIFNLARFLGPMLAAFLIGKIGIAGCYFLNSLSFLAVIITLFLIKIKKKNFSKEKVRGSFLENIRQAFFYLKKKQAVFLLIFLMAVVSFFVFSFVILLPVFAKDILLGNEKTFGFLRAGLFLGAFFGSLSVFSLGKKIKKQRLLFYSCLFLVFSLFLFSLSKNFFLTLLSLIIAGFSFSVFNSLDNSLIQLIIPDNLRGKIMAIYVLAYGGVNSLGSLYMSFLADFLGVLPAIFISLIIALVFFLLIFHFFKLEKELEGFLATTK